MRSLSIVLCLLIAACDAGSEPDVPATPIAAAGAVRAGMPLDSMLYQLDLRLTEAIERQLDDQGTSSFIAAETITDRLLEARMPFEWLDDQDYSVQARLRQIQSAADRVMARIRTDVDGAQTMTDLRGLREDVVALRRAIARGGTRAPPDIHALLASDTVRQPTQRPAARDTPTGPRPIGEPLPPP